MSLQATFLRGPVTAGRRRVRSYGAVSIVVLMCLAGCGGGGGKELSAAEKRAQAIAQGNVALCNNGDFSNNTSFRATCSGADGLDEWLAEYGECEDGTIITMSKESSCGGHGGFKGLKPEGFKPGPKPDDVALCNSGTYSNNTDFRATCSGGGGVDHWLADYGECVDGTVIVMNADASCRDRGGFKGLKPEGFKPGPKPDDVALCNSGTYSNNTDFHATCSGGGGVDRWLAEYGECQDGTVIEMDASSSCSGHGGFKALKPTDYEPPATTTTTTAPTTAVPPERVLGILPGVRTGELVSWLTQNGWVCEEQKDFAELVFLRYCDKGMGTVEIFTPKSDPNAVFKMGVTVFLQAEWAELKMLGSYPIDGVVPGDVSGWIDAQISGVQQGRPVEAEFGGLPYMLAGSGTSRTLEIGHELPFTDADFE